MKTKSILLVEDNPDDQELTLLALSKAQLHNHIDVVGDGKAALDYLWRCGEYAHLGGDTFPGVVLLDINLPKIDGLEVLRRLRGDERTRLQPVVILTSSKEEIDLLQGYQFGCNSYIHKPVDFEQFVIAIRQLGIYWLTLNESPPTKIRA